MQKYGSNKSRVLNLLNSNTCIFQFGEIFVALLIIKLKYKMETRGNRGVTETMKNCCGKVSNNVFNSGVWRYSEDII
jgi:hypothetical protein